MRQATLLLATIGLLSACDRAVLITEPAVVSPKVPVTQLAVHFTNRYETGFKAEFDGQNVTQSFKPAAVANGDAVDDLNDPQGFTGGTTTPPGAPLPLRSVLEGSGGGGQGGTPGQIPPTGPVTGTTTGVEAPNIAFNTHTLRVWGKCRNGQWCDSDQITFFPMHLFVVKSTAEPQVGTIAHFFVRTFPTSTVEFDATATPNTDAIRLNAAPANTPVIVKISGGQGDLYVHGLRAGLPYAIIITARGLQKGSTDGVVMR